MTAKFNYTFAVILTATIFLTFSSRTNSQGLFDRLEKKGRKAFNNKIDKATDDVLNGQKKTATTINDDDNQKKIKKDDKDNRRPKLSELKDKDFIQNSTNPPRDEKNTRYRIAKNLMVDINGKYPNGYQPKWRFVSYNSNLKFSRENWVRPTAQLGYEDKAISIGDYGGKAVIRFKPHFDCECFADIIIKDSVSVLTDNPQVYEIGNFRKILNEMSTGEPCVGGLSNAAKGGWGGKITLSANKNGDLLMSLMLEDYTLPRTKTNVYDSKTKTRSDVYYPSQVNFRFSAKDITVENELSAEKANGIIAAELEAKRKYVDYIKKSEIQIKDLKKVISSKYPGYNCLSCFSRTSSYGTQPTTTKIFWSNGRVTEDYNLNITTTMKIENKCNQELTFIGIQQLYDDINGYTYKDVSRTMEAKYYYQVKEGLFMSIFTSVAGIDGDIKVYPDYNLSAARIGGIQWIKVIGKKKP